MDPTSPHLRFSLIRILLATALLSSAQAQLQHAATTNSAANLQAEARKLQVAPSLSVQVWAAEPQLLNPVAFSLVPAAASPGSPAPRSETMGVEAFVAETHRYGVSVLDITQNTPWLLNDLSLRHASDRSAFLRERFATNSALLTRDSEIVRHLADVDGDGRAERSTVFASEFQSELDGTAAGILALGTNVWFANIPNLWRLARSGPTPSAVRDRLAHGFGVHIGVTGHDLHGLILGPDQRLYASFGDRGLSLTNQEGLLLHAPDTGGVVRCNPDGSDLTLFCIGLRNPQELVFDDAGNLFTSDNDTAGTDPCRVLHLIEGADYGWRASYQHMKGFGPWVQEELWRGDLDGIPPVAGTVSQGPAGLTYYPGTGFGDRFTGCFLHCDFPGGVWTFRLRPEGATFIVGDPQKLVWNCWPTDVEFGPDGALYLLDWVAGWGLPKQGRIYRITSADTATAAARDTYRLLAGDPTRESSASLRARLAHADYRVRLAAQWELARRGRDSLPALATEAEHSHDSRARRHALWGIAQILRQHPPDSIYRDGTLLSSLARLTQHADPETATPAIRLLGEFSTPKAREAVSATIYSSNPRLRFEALLASAAMGAPSHRLASADRIWTRAFLSVMGKSGLSTQAPPVQHFAHFLGNGTSATLAPFELVARSIAGARARESILLDPLFGNRPDAGMFVFRHPIVLALRRQASPALTNFLTDPAPRLVLEAARAIHDVPIPAGLPALGDLLQDERLATWTAFDAPTFTAGRPVQITNSPARRSPRDQILRRALNAHFRQGQTHHALALAQYAGRDTAPPELRAEALFLLSRWEITAASPGHVPVFPAPDPHHGAVPSVNPEQWPGWFDRVTGAWRPLPPRPADAARTALAPLASRLLNDPAEVVALASLEASERLGFAHTAPALAARIADPSAPAAFRARALQALARLDPARMPHAVAAAFASADPVVEAAAVPYVDHLEGEAGTQLVIGRLRAELERLTSANPPPLPPQLAQALVQALGKSNSPASATARADLGRRLLEGQLPASLELEVVEALQQAPDPRSQELYAQWRSATSILHPTSAGREVLHGGDARRGATLFAEKAETQCARCHQVAGNGGIVGPALDQVGTRLTRAQILEAIVTPNATISPGYESATITLTDGRELHGIVRAQSDAELLLLSPEDGELTLPQSTVRERRPGLSAMPEGLAPLLTRRELRDLIEYLARRGVSPP